MLTFFGGCDLYDYYKLFRNRQGKDIARELALELEKLVRLVEEQEREKMAGEHEYKSRID